MGRKRMQEAGSRRRKVLQLDSKKSRLSQPNALSGLVGQYEGSDDDEDQDNISAGIPPPANGNKPPDVMDTKLADFLAEIDALDSGSNTPQHTEPDSTETQAANTKEGDSASVEETVTEAQDWQEILDPNTNCYYYWNARTNEVTWEIPSMYKQPSATTTTTKGAESATPEEREPTLLEKLTRQEPDSSGGGKEKEAEKEKEDSQSEEAVADVETTMEVTSGGAVKGVVGYESPEEEDTNSDDDEDTNETEKPQSEVKESDEEQAQNDKDVELKSTEDRIPLDGTKIFDGNKSVPDESRVGGRKTSEGKSLAEDEEEDDEDLSRYELFEDEEEEEVGHKNVMKDDTEGEEDGGDDVEDIDKQLERELEQKKAELRKLELMDDQEVEQDDRKVKSQGEDKKMDSEEEEPVDNDVGDEDELEEEEEEEEEVIQKLESDLKRKLEELGGIDDNSEVEVNSGETGKRKIEEVEKEINNENEVASIPSKKMRPAGFVETMDMGVQCDFDSHEETANQKKTKEDEQMKAKIVDLASTLTSKLHFLGISKKGLTKFQLLLISTETRIQDWRDGIIESNHLLAKLKTADWELEQYESEAAPRGWSCHWDRNHKQYFYMNQSTGESQWEYPLQAMKLEQEKMGITGKEDSQAAFNQASSVDGIVDSNEFLTNLIPCEEKTKENAPAEESIKKGKKIKSKVKKKSKKETPAVTMKEEVPPPIPALEVLSEAPPPPPEPDSVSNPPPPPPPSEPYPPPPPDEPPPPGTEADIPPLPPSPPPPEDSDVPPPPPLSPPPPLPSSEADPQLPPGLVVPPPLPPQAPPEDELQEPEVPPPEPESNVAIIGKPQLIYDSAQVSSLPQLYSAQPMYDGYNIDGEPVEETPDSSLEPRALKKNMKMKVKSKKAKDKKLLAKKKIPHSLVEKWKQIKEEQAKEEEGSSSSEEEDQAIITQRRIMEWKKEQIEKGKAQYNANFEAIRGDWRERLKKKKKGSAGGTS